jgi:hypothetical protein
MMTLDAVPALVRSGFAVLPLDAIPQADDLALWDGFESIPRRQDSSLRHHLLMKHQFDGLEVHGHSAFNEATGGIAEQLSAVLAGELHSVAVQLSEQGYLPPDVVSGERRWASNATVWDSSEHPRLPFHIDWEVLSFVLSPDGALELGDGSCPQGPVAVLVAGALCNKFSGGRIPGGLHGVGKGGSRRSFQVFYLGNGEVCRCHGIMDCATGESVRNHLTPQYELETRDYVE